MAPFVSHAPLPASILGGGARGFEMHLFYILLPHTPVLSLSNMMRKFFPSHAWGILLCFLMGSLPAFAQQIRVLSPPHWWIGMQYNRVEVLVQGEKLKETTFSIAKPAKTRLLRTYTFDNPNVVVLELDFGKVTAPETVEILYGNGQKFSYEVKAKDPHPQGLKGLSPADLVYLITPDRFANGNPANDRFGDMQQTKVDRDGHIERHGGDLEGITQHLDYIKKLGMTAVWINPVETNDQAFQSYHGFGITHFYEVDKRFGGHEAYRRYIQKSRELGLKVVKDVVFNHVGNFGELWLNKPDSTWFNPQTSNNFRTVTNIDPYRAQYDWKSQQKGWFDPVLPDLNQDNPRVAAYLIQYALWWIQEYGIDAYRVDTQAYPTQDFMWKMMDIVRREYPSFTIFAEIWDTGAPTQSWFSVNRNPALKTPHVSSIGVTDFELQSAFRAMFNEPNGWQTGVSRLYYTLAYDYIYPDASQNVIFLDNHDINRYLHDIGKDVNALKLATTILLTTRGIPQWYYGSEILFKAEGHHGHIRQDFPGGWPGDPANKFVPEGRSAEENDFVQYLSTLANWRKTSAAIAKGRLTQFVPFDNVYAFIRHHEGQKVLVLVNFDQESRQVSMDRFRELIPAGATGREVLSGQTLNLSQSLRLEPRKAYVIDIR